MWYQREAKDGTYNYIDLQDALEMLTVRNENNERAREHAMREAHHV